MTPTFALRCVLYASLAAGATACTTAEPTCGDPAPHVDANVRTTFSPRVTSPHLEHDDYVHPLASVIGAVDLGHGVFVAPGASIRGDEGQPIVIGAGSNVQDGVVVHGLETFANGRVVESNTVLVDGVRYAVHVGRDVSLAHQAQVHGPARVGDGTFVGMQALVFRAEVGKNCVLEPRALVMGVNVDDGRYVVAGQIVRTQEDADRLPRIDEGYAFAHINDGVLHVNHELAEGYAARGR